MARSGGDATKGSRLVMLASVCVVIAALFLGREVLIPLALAVLLSFLLSPVVSALERRRLPRAAATLLVVVIAVGAIGFVGYLVYHQAITLVNDLPNYRGQLQTKLGGIGSHGVFWRKAEKEIREIGRSATSQPSTQPAAVAAALPANPAVSESQPEVDGVPPAAASHAPVTQPTVDNPMPVRVIPQTTTFEVIRDYAARVLDPLATAGLVLIFMIFMLLNREDLRDRMIKLVGHGRLNLTTQAFDEAGTRISRYLGALAIVNGIYAAVVAVGLWLIGHLLGHGHAFPNVLVFGILVGLFRFVPYVGIWIGAAFPLILSFALFPGYAAFFATIGLFGVLEVVVSQFVEPFWYGASTGMSALAVLVAAVFWTWLWGPIGLLLSTPLTVCLVVMGKYVPQLQFLDILLRDEPVLEPPVRVYQRLIAEDPEEATELAHDYLKDRSLEAVYDQILIPALSLAERDRHRGRLEPERYESVLQGMRDIAEELADRQRMLLVQQEAADTVEAAKTGVPVATPTTEPAGGAGARSTPTSALEARRTRLPRLPKECRITILCLPARAHADEIVAMMLGQLLELRGFCAEIASENTLASEMVEMVEQKKSDLVCISAMPPAAIAHARYLCKRLHARHEGIRTVIGVWTVKSDLKRAKERITCDESVQLVTTLAEAQNQIDELVHPLMTGASGDAAAPAPTNAPREGPRTPAHQPA